MNGTESLKCKQLSRKKFISAHARDIRKLQKQLRFHVANVNGRTSSLILPWSFTLRALLQSYLKRISRLNKHAQSVKIGFRLCRNKAWIGLWGPGFVRIISKSVFQVSFLALFFFLLALFRLFPPLLF